MNEMLRTTNAALRNGIIWAAAWGLAGGAIIGTIALVNPGAEAQSIVERVAFAGLSGVAWGVRFGIAGAVIGTLFSVAVRIGYRSKRLGDIKPLRFAALGAVVGGVAVPLFYQAMNILTEGRAVDWALVLDDAPWAAVFGAAVAGGSIIMARRAAELPEAERPEPLGKVSEVETLSAGAGAETSSMRRFRSVTS